MKTKNFFDNATIEAFKPAEKIGIVATINDLGLPHISLITSMMAKNEKTLLLGQFCQGLSKQYLAQRPQAGFLVMTLDKKLWRGKAKWQQTLTEGEDYEAYNNIPMFRYNTYFGINTVHYLDLIEVSDEALPMVSIVGASLLSTVAKNFVSVQRGEKVLKPFAENLFNGFSSLKFIAYIGKDGFPVIIPTIQARVAGAKMVVFSPLAYGDELDKIEIGTTIAVFCLSMAMESVLTRGIFNGFTRYGAIKLGVMDIDWVYNSMPPCHGQIYPPVPLEPIKEF